MRSIIKSGIGAGFPAPKVDYLRLMRMVTETVMAITAATVMMMLIIVASFPPGKDFPGLQLTGRGLVRDA
jgi:hypothetical protein